MGGVFFSFNTHPCGTFGQICAKLCRASGQHHSAKEWMRDDLNGSGWQLLLLLLTGQLHHLLHETHTILCRYRADRLDVGVWVCVTAGGRKERWFVTFSMEEKLYL